MSLVLADRVRETTTSTGTGTITLNGAVDGYQSFAVIGNNNTTYYTISNTSQWEVGIGQYYGGTLSRDTIISSSTGSKLNLIAGTKDVFVTYPSEFTANATGGGVGSILLNASTVTANATIASGQNGFSVGPLTVNSGVTITIASGQRHVII